MDIYIGCAGWNLRKECAADFPLSGTHLQRYAARFNAVELNSSFYRPHRIGTYQRWAASTPAEFRFAVKCPKQITHLNRLLNAEQELERFCIETSGLGEKLGPILVQLPPSLALDTTVAERFFRELRSQLSGLVVCEPRHRTWFGEEAESLLKAYAIGRVAADPSVVPAAALPGGDLQNCYFRWHGSPRIYYSMYDELQLSELANQLVAATEHARSVWCIFDNTAVGAALQNAMALSERVKNAVPAGNA